MKPIIFARIADMKFYNGITENDTPHNGGSFVSDTGQAHECFNFSPVGFLDGRNVCIGFSMLTGGTATKDPELHIEKIVGCEGMKKADKVTGVTVVFCSKAVNSQTIRVVGFYKNATVYRNYQYADFESGYRQAYSFEADMNDCVLLPVTERHGNSAWYVPVSQKRGSSFGYGRSHIWFAGSNTDDEKEIAYVERMLYNIEHYAGENWMDRKGK